MYVLLAIFLYACIILYYKNILIVQLYPFGLFLQKESKWN